MPAKTSTSGSAGQANLHPPSSTAIPSTDLVRAVVLAARLPVGLSRSAVAAIPGQILVLGGMLPNGSTTDTIYRFTGGAASPQLAGHLVLPRHDVASAVIGSRVLVIGGGDAAADRSAESFTAPGMSRLVGQLPRARADLDAVTIGAEALVIGGAGAADERSVLATTDGAHYRVVAELPVGLRYAAVVASGDRVYVVGGTSPAGDVATIERVDPVAGTVQVIGHMPFALSHAAGLSLVGHLLILGGRRSGTAQRGIWELDSNTGRVRLVGQLPYAVSDAPAATIGQVGYLFGGESTVRLANIIALTMQ